MNISEFQFIDKIKDYFPSPESTLGIGDDCAVIPYSDEEFYLVTTDALIEDVHFSLSAISYKALGWKSVAVNLSDIAAMGGITKYLFISIAIPKKTNSDEIFSFYEGVKEIVSEYQVFLLGGDTTSSKDRLCISITAIGTCFKDKILLRTGAKPGDYIYVTGTLGDSSAGLLLSQSPKQSYSQSEEYLMNRHFHPTPRLKEINYLVNHYQLNSAIDISDGLSSDLNHILQGSQLGAKVNWTAIPKSKELQSVLKGKPLEEAVLNGGEDYEILFSSPDIIDLDLFFKETGTILSQIGFIHNEKGIGLTKEGFVEKLEPLGYDHFK